MENATSKQNAGVWWFAFMDSVVLHLVTTTLYTQNATDLNCMYSTQYQYFPFYSISDRTISL